MDVDSLLLLINAIFTTFSGVYIAYLMRFQIVKRHIFYYFFTMGFIIYGIEIFLRWVSPNYFPISAYMLAASVFLFSLGMWSLRRKKSLLVVIVVCILIACLIISMWIMKVISFETGLFATPIGYFPLILLLIYHSATLGKIADKFIFGWFLLLFTNFILLGRGWITDFFAIFSKVVILRGILDYDFIILTQRVQREISSHTIPVDTGYEEEGKLNLVTPPPGALYSIKTEWIHKTIQKNLKKGVKTHLFVFQDVIPYRELRRLKWVNPEQVSVFLFSTSAERTKKEFAVLPMGLTEIGAALSEVIRRYTEVVEGCTVIFIDLSVLVHMYGVYPVYNMLLSKMGSLREARVNLFAFFQPETHSEQFVVSLFTNLAEEIIKL